MTRVLHPRTINLARRHHLPQVPRLTKQNRPAALMLRIDVQVPPVEVVTVLVAARKVKFRTARERPAIDRFRRIKLQAQNRVLHRQRRVVVAVVLVRFVLHKVRRPVRIKRTRRIHALKHQITIRRNLQARLAQRFKNPRHLVSQIILLALGRENTTGLAHFRPLFNGNLARLRFTLRSRRDRRRLALEFRNLRGLSLVFRLQLRNAFN